MSQVIRIADDLYERLESHAKGFDTPSNVLEKILDAYEGIESKRQENTVIPDQPSKLDLVFHPNTEEKFKEIFIFKKKAFVKLTYSNGDTEVKEWISARFTESSSVSGNLRSGYLRDWKKKGIVKAEVAINEIDFK